MTNKYCSIECQLKHWHASHKKNCHIQAEMKLFDNEKDKNDGKIITLIHALETNTVIIICLQIFNTFLYFNLYKISYQYIY